MVSMKSWGQGTETEEDLDYGIGSTDPPPSD
jgi:hypothetical protein